MRGRIELDRLDNDRRQGRFSLSPRKPGKSRLAHRCPVVYGRFRLHH